MLKTAYMLKRKYFIMFAIATDIFDCIQWNLQQYK